MEDRARHLEDRVEALAREIVTTINEAEAYNQPGLRHELKDFAIGLIQDSVVSSDAVQVSPVVATDARFNPVAMGIPLFFAGAVLVFLFPPVGMMLFAAAAVMIVWGLVASMFTRSRVG